MANSQLDDALRVRQHIEPVRACLRDHLRRDYRTSRLIYRSQIIHHAFGPGAARAFMKAARIAPPLVERVLNGAPGRLRR